MSKELEITLTKLDECCLTIECNNSLIGVWCPETCRVVVDGEIIGFASTKEEVISGLVMRDFPRWVME